MDHLELLDQHHRPLSYLRVSVTDRCNFRCGYCMPAHIYHPSYPFIPQTRLLSFEEITRLNRILTDLGVRKIRLTGGEPLLRRELEKLVAMLVELPGIDEISMTTNGFLLEEKVGVLKQAGLKRLNVSVDSLNPQVFRTMNGDRADLDVVMRGIQAAEEFDFSPLKINCVVQRGFNDHTIIDLAMHFRERGHIVRFIEFMDVGNSNDWRMDRVVTTEEMIAQLSQHERLVPVPAQNPFEVARRYRYEGGGEVGFISSVSQPFCGGCTRLRLAADGILYTCLFSDRGHDLRDALRSGQSDEQIERTLTAIWRRRSDRYSEVRVDAPRSQERVEMHRVGG